MEITTLGDRIKAVRTSNNLTQEQLSEITQISKAAIWKYENNRRQPIMENLLKISKILNVKLEVLTNDKEFAKWSKFTETLTNAKKNVKSKSYELDDETITKIKMIVGVAFKDFLCTTNSEYIDMDTMILADIAQSKEFHEHLNYLYFKYKNKENH